MSLRGTRPASAPLETLFRYGREGIFACSLMVFLLFCGSDLPYRGLSSFYAAGLRNLRIPDEAALGNLDIRTLRADAGSVRPSRAETEPRRLWEVPHFFYRMERGDTISQISRQYGIAVGTLLSFNRIDNVKNLKEGRVLLIPETDGILYSPAEGLFIDDAASLFGLETEALLRYNPYLELEGERLKAEKGRELFLPGAVLPEQRLREQMGELFVYPVSGPVIKGFGDQVDVLTQIAEFHNGVDIKGREGDPVKAALDGRVIARGFNSSYGRYLILEHSGGFRTLYAQLREWQVQKEDKVLQGEVIGNVGSSGYARVPHLHFSLFKGKKSIDPMDYLH